MAALTVLGIGNILMRDEAVGVRLMEAVQAARPWPAEVEFIDGGAGGLNLINVIEDAQRMIVFDAAEMGLAPGEFRIVPPTMLAEEMDLEHRVSMHDMPFTETLRLVGRFFRRPSEVTLLAIEPKVVDFGRQMSPELTAAMPRLLEAGVALVAGAIGEKTG